MKSNNLKLLNHISINDLSPYFCSICEETKILVMLYQDYWLYQDLNLGRFNSPVNFSGIFIKAVFSNWLDLTWKLPLICPPVYRDFFSSNLFGRMNGNWELNDNLVDITTDIDTEEFEDYKDAVGLEASTWTNFVLTSPKFEIEVNYSDFSQGRSQYEENREHWIDGKKSDFLVWSQLAKTPEEFAKISLDDFIKFITNKTPRELNLQSNRIREFEKFLTEQGIPFEPTPKYDWQKYSKFSEILQG